MTSPPTAAQYLTAIKACLEAKKIWADLPEEEKIGLAHPEEAIKRLGLLPIVDDKAIAKKWQELVDENRKVPDIFVPFPVPAAETHRLARATEEITKAITMLRRMNHGHTADALAWAIGHPDGDQFAEFIAAPVVPTSLEASIRDMVAASGSQFTTRPGEIG